MYLLNKVVRKLRPKTLPAPGQREISLISLLRAKIRALPQACPSVNASPAEHQWVKNRLELRRQLLAEDPRDFLNFKVIRETMFVDHPPFVKDEIASLRQNPKWASRWKLALTESRIIAVPPCPYYMKSNGTAIHHAVHLQQFEAATGLDVSRFNSVLEFGGGYGSMCRVLHGLGFQGRYFIFDLPEFSALQEFYLQANEIPVHPFALTPPAGAVCFSDFAQFEELNRTSPPDLFLATWSLSETPVDFRRRVLTALNARCVLIAYQHEFEAIDNSKFFSEWTHKNPGKQWRIIPTVHLPGRNFYLVGMPREIATAS